MNKPVLLDTNVWARTLVGPEGLSERIIEQILNAPAVYVSPISAYEIGQKCRLGKWPEMEPFVRNLPKYLVQQGAQWAPLNAEILLQAATIDWPHRDPFDRIIVATALAMGVQVLSTDQTITDFLGSDRAVG